MIQLATTPDDARIQEVAASVFRQSTVCTLNSLIYVRNRCIVVQLTPMSLAASRAGTVAMVHLQLSEDNRRLWLLSIDLPSRLRGLGLGEELYDLVCELASQLGAECVEQTASGQTRTKEYRGDYLARHGWIKRDGCIYYKLIKPQETHRGCSSQPG